MSELGISNVIARSAFINQVDEELCLACEDCLDYCQFSALTLENVVVVNQVRCVGCGVCVPHCPEGALGLIRRPIEEITPPPVTQRQWLTERAHTRGINIDSIF
jgi:heterodisulfide reductase subunit A-like polyferredoxin